MIEQVDRENIYTACLAGPAIGFGFAMMYGDRVGLLVGGTVSFVCVGAVYIGALRRRVDILRNRLMAELVLHDRQRERLIRLQGDFV